MSAVPVPEEGAATAPTREGRRVAVVIGGQRAVAWTDAEGEVRAARDVCPHRRAPLSAGTVVGGHLVCPYHGWSYDGSGRCTWVPALGPDGRVPRKARLDLLPVPPDLATAVPPAGTDRPRARPPAGTWLDGDTPALARAWHPVARRGELPTGGSPVEVELLGRRWTIVGGADGAWSGVTAVGADAWGVRPHLDHLWLAPEEPMVDLPPVPEWGALGWHHRRMKRIEGDLGVGLLLDNQFDAGHFPFVHAATFGTPAAEQATPADVARDGTVVTCAMRVPIAAKNDPKAVAGDRPLVQHRVMHYEFHAPLWLRLRLDYEDMGGSTVILFGLTPLGPGRARMDIDLLFHHPDGFTDAQLDDRVAFEERVVAEDLRLQLLFEDRRLPLDATAELHARADRFSLQCRQLLRELLVEP